MKHKRLTAAVLAAALWLTGCGGAAAPAAPAGSGAASQSAADTAVQTAQKDRITEQFTLEKTVRNEWGSAQKLTIHVPQLVCDSPDAEYINDELAARYAAEYRDYESYPQADVTLTIRNAYNHYVDVCIGGLGASFHPVIYLLTEDGFVEYVDVLRCLLYGQILLCADPIYIANNGTALALRDAEVRLLCADGTETELAPLTAEWNSPQQVDSTGSFSLGERENLCWLDLNSGGGCQLATHNNRYFYQGAVTYLGATPDGTALGFSLIRDTENGPEWVAFSAALKLDYRIDCLILTPLSGQNPLTNEMVPLVLTHSYG